MVTKLAIVPTCRPDRMREFLWALGDCPQLRDWRVVAITQEYPTDDYAYLRAHPLVLKVIALDARQPVYPLRVEAMRALPADVYVNCDDDMLPLAYYTYWDVMAERLLADPSLGVVSGNWARSMAMLKYRDPTDEYVYQPITNMAGGQMYRADVARWLADNPYCPIGPYMFDDIQASMTAYLGGWRNARYRGSVLIHNILSPGGLKVQFNDTELWQPDPRFIVTRKAKAVYQADNNYYMPIVSDVQPEAHALHRANRAQRFGELCSPST